MLMGFLSSFSCYFSLVLSRISRIHVILVWPGHFPVWVCFIASLTSYADVSASSSVIATLWSFSFMFLFLCFYFYVFIFIIIIIILLIALLLAIFICGFLGVVCGSLMQCLPFFWFLFVWYLLQFVALVSYCLVLLVCFMQTSI